MIDWTKPIKTRSIIDELEGGFHWQRAEFVGRTTLGHPQVIINVETIGQYGGLTNVLVPCREDGEALLWVVSNTESSQGPKDS